VIAGRDARLGRASLPVSARRAACAVAAALTLLHPPAAQAQEVRPWLDWTSLETEHFVFHYPTAYRTWTLALAQRIESVRAQVTPIVGWAPDARVHVVVDDPSNITNGFAYSALDAPAIVLWPSPPNPRQDIGNFRVWQELIATHEYAHIAQLTRPSRNRWQRRLWSLSPVPLGPITTEAPRWVLEGYATYVEGRVTGTGRPNNAWRAAMLRQLALEGRLPSYGQLNGSPAWEGGSSAYLVGSAYLEWLARREGDSSLVAMWRRMTAVTTRSFGEAFTGVYGDSPAVLYGRFTAEITAEAFRLERGMRQEGLIEGALVQRLQRTTGDPAISPDGRFVALTVRHQDAPSQLVVWRTASEPDTAARRRNAELTRRDPDDVPDRRFYPPPRRAVISLMASDGAPYETPRWFADNRHVLLTRNVPAADGTVRADLYVWSAEDGDLRRVTHGAGLRDADPSPDGSWAAATRCEHGWCDLVRVDLTTGTSTVLLAGSVERNYYRPRVAAATGEIVAGEQSGDRWRVIRVSSADGAWRYADPEDGVSRYDATWTPDGASIVVTSEATGIANLERLDAERGVHRLTSVTGAAVAADVAPDGAIWFLSLQAGGFDLRRLGDSARAVPPGVPASLALADSLAPILPPRLLRLPFDSSARPRRRVIGEEEPYGLGPSRFRYLPGATSGYGGTAFQLAIVRSDPVGRLGAQLLVSAGAGALPAGLAATVNSRVSRTELHATAWISHEAPSSEYGPALADALDLHRAGGAVGFRRRHAGDGGDALFALTLLGESQRATGFESSTRGAGVLALNFVRRQRDDATRYVESLSALGEAGSTAGGGYFRQRAALAIGVAARSEPLTTLRLAYGSVGGGGGAARERFVVGGTSGPLMDPELDARRVEAPAYPLGSTVGSSFAAYRVGVPVAPLELYYAGASTDAFQHPLRSYGAEWRQRASAIPALGMPDVALVAGIARAVDEPVKGTWRFYMTIAIQP
jgi:Tol biopolymer transport system component